ncbi:hypothetical protein FRC07_009855, partial [Ceratobasidium sp. 392]
WAFGGDYVGPVREMLAPMVGRQRKALELGTRTGTWIQAMAAEFPHVQFRSIDAVPMIAHSQRPNITFEVYDFTEGLLEEDESQDVVFLHVVLEIVKDYRSLLREVHRVLRPGGLIHINEYNPHLWDAQNPSIPAHRTNPTGYRLFSLARAHLTKMGIDSDTCNKLPGWLAPSSELWGDEADRRKGFEQIESVIKIYPAFPHEGLSCTQAIDSQMIPLLAHLTVMSTRDMLTLLKDGGMKDEEAEELIESMLEELKNHGGCALLKLYSVHAVKL